MKRGLLWLGVVVGAALVAVGVTLSGPWIGTIAGVALAGACGAGLTDHEAAR